MSPSAELQQMLALATRLAVEGGRIARARLGTARATRKLDDSEVTDVDVAIETYVLEAIGEVYPQHAALCEEGVQAGVKGKAGEAEFCWVIDPLDGTRNYIRQLPIFCTSIAVLQHGAPLIGVIHSPMTDQTFTVLEDGPVRGATGMLRASARLLDRDALLGVPTGRHRPSVKVVQAWAEKWVLRNLGSTALHLALVASGALDGAFCCECKLWDIAAGALLIERAGGVCTDFEGRSLFPFPLGRYRGEDMPVLAAGPNVHAELLKSMRAALVSAER
jgi:myo-inositol-1(or 4)-monophosphatase